MTITPRQLGAQSLPCLPSDSVAAVVGADLRFFVSSPRSDAVAARLRRGLPAASASEVVHVDDPAVCGAAIQVFNAAHGLAPASRNVHVFQVRSVYVVFDPAEPGPGIEFRRFATVDSSFTLVARWSQ